MKNLAVCGVGNIGKVHVRNLLSLRGCRIAGVFDTQAATLNQVASEYGLPIYPSWRALLEDPTLDGVVIATPAASHRELCCQALAAGKHVFLEKPLASSLTDSLAIVEAAAKAGDRVVQVGFCERFSPAYLEAKSAVEQGRLGALRVVQTSRIAPFHMSDPSWELGVYDTAAHNLDLILWLKGAVPRSVLARGTGVYGSGPHFCSTWLSFADGSLAVDTIAWLRLEGHPLSECAQAEMLLQGTKGSFRVDHTARPAWCLDDQRFRAVDTVILGGEGYYSCLKLQFDYFLSAISGEVAPKVTAAEALASERVVLAAVESVKTGREVGLVT
ncbi:MAG: Gfo/Idh/MocA family oxidoreductase [Acidobacteriota bacterium]